jgi:phosphoribosylformylglycinamidine synthase subunit PurS
MKYLAEIEIMPKKEILDPQGKAVKLGLENMGFEGVEDIRIGKHVTIEIQAASEEEANGKVESACEKLLANLIMETYSFTVSAI